MGLALSAGVVPATRALSFSSSRRRRPERASLPLRSGGGAVLKGAARRPLRLTAEANYSAASFSFFSGRTLTLTLAGLAGNQRFHR